MAARCSHESDGVVRVAVKERLEAGRLQVILGVYVTREGGTPIASEWRAVSVDANGSFTTPLGTLAALAGSGEEERWLALQLVPGREAARVQLSAGPHPPVIMHVVTDAAIWANGIIESVSQGFRFPDGTIQTSAATVSGGVPSVNGIGGAVTVVGEGTASVLTAGSTITVRGSSPTFGDPVSISTTNAEGVANSVARSDHAHAHGNLPGGDLHATATSGSAGFMSPSDRTKLDATVAYVRTVVVSPIAGDSIGSGTALRNALNGISATSTNPYLLKIEPGIYDIGNTPLQMLAYVDVEGSGEPVTIINAACGSATSSSSAAAVLGAANAEIRNLTINNTSTSPSGIGFYASGTTVRMRDATINSTGATAVSTGIYAATGALSLFRTTVNATAVGGSSGAIALRSVGASLAVGNSTFAAPGVGGTGSNRGFLLDGTSSTTAATIDSSTLMATGTASSNMAVLVTAGRVTITNSTLRVDTAGVAAMSSPGGLFFATLNVSHSLILTGGSSSSALQAVVRFPDVLSIARVATSMVDGGASGSVTCVHNYDENFVSLGNTCPGPTS